MNFNIDVCDGYRKEVIGALLSTIEKNNFILGDNVREFEKEWAAYNRVPFAVGVSSGTEAIRLALLALGVGPGDEVVSPAHNVAYTALAVQSIGARNIFVDIDPHTMLMDVDKVREVLTEKTRVILPVHLYGQMVNMFALQEIATEKGLLLVEDAAQAHGATVMGASPGMLSDAAAFSFYPTKNLGAWGEAGGVVTKLPIIAQRVRLLRDGGRTDRYVHAIAGVNSCLDELQASILRVKLKYLDESNNKRRHLAKRYRSRLLGIGDIKFQEEAPYTDSVYHLFVIRTSRREKLMAYLKERGIPSLVHYPVPVSRQPFVLTEALSQGNFPVADSVSSSVLSLPMFPSLSEAEQDRVITAISDFYGT